MPFYTFETKDDKIGKKVFTARLSFAQYDEVTKGDLTKDGWFQGIGPEHPDTEQPVTTWRRVLDSVKCNFAQPWESSRWDNFEYRAGYNMTKAKKERSSAEEKSHMGSNPLLDQEGFDLGQQDMETHENRVE